MKTRIFSAISALAVLVLFISAAVPLCAQTLQYKLQPTDTLLITVHGQEDLTTKTRVGTEGYVTFPLVGQVYAKGLTAQQLEERLKVLLEKDYLVNAQVVVFIETYHPRQVSVLGEVTTPGKFDMPEQKEMTLLDAIAMAEGFTKDALLTRVKIIRRNEDGTEEIIVVNVKEIIRNNKKEQNIVLEPDDIVIVPESFF
jgi:polysaccharide export outer membrane protein